MSACLFGLEIFEGPDNKNNDALFMRLDLVTMNIAVCDHNLAHIEDFNDGTLGMMCLAVSRCCFQSKMYIYQSQ